MTVKTRGIRLKNHLDPEDQGQRKLMQVTYSQLVATGQNTPPIRADDSRLEHTPENPQSKMGTSVSARRRAIARMLRVELEATLALLDHALASIGQGTNGPTDESPRN